MFFGPPGWFGLLVPLTAIICTFMVLMRLLRLAQSKAQSKQDTLVTQQFEELQAQLRARDRDIEGLENRIRVLERIVTDDSRRLSDEIERLRA